MQSYLAHLLPDIEAAILRLHPPNILVDTDILSYYLEGLPRSGTAA